MPKFTRFPFFGKRFFRQARKMLGSCEFQHLWRWGIELVFKMSKQYLGLGDYQMLEYRGVARYLHLVMIAYLLLTHRALEADVNARAKRLTPLRLPSIQQLQVTVRGQLWDDLIMHLESGTKTRVAARKIKLLIQK